MLCGGPTRETSSLVYALHREGLEAQADGFELEIRHELCTDPGGPRWHGDKIERVARVRQKFMDAAAPVFRLDERRAGYDALLMVDSDVILGPGVLSRLWQVDAPVAFGTFWTLSDWGGSRDFWPQVWDIHPYGWTPETGAALGNALSSGKVEEIPVLGGGACTLFRGKAFDSHYWPLLESLRRLPGMNGGEDRAYCLGLEARGIKQIAVTGLPIKHCYEVADQTRPALERIRAEVGL